ncbi:zinc-dependent metalloprotease [Segetibacter koreensis]|uniref:zinc-dependent metalloprotease n=1 Tax=Segetibacter koreensis TaxID=398037 RepID=UPI000376FC93|nr:zinc-dependent metalloprotease [Segetibacter koreensis]
MKKIVFMLLIIISATTAIAQKKIKTPPAVVKPPVTTSAPAGLFTGLKAGPKSYNDIITDKAVTQKGLFTVHKVEDKYYFEIGDSVMNREIMTVTRFVKVPASKGVGRGAYGGELTNQQTIAFEKGPSDNVFMRVITLVNVADTSNAIYKAVTNSNLNAIAAAFPIAAYSKDSSGVVIDVTEFFKGDNQVVSVNPTVKRNFNLSSLAYDRSYIQNISSFPLNTEIRTVKTFNSSPSFGLFSSVAPSSNIPAANAAGVVTIELNTSMILLPEKPMEIRYWDRRVGFFPEDFTTFSDNQQRTESNIFAVRWRLEPKDEDIKKWQRGELVEPKKPIIYYIDPATPPKWRKFLIAGINDWQVAFEKAGFKNAIIGKEWPQNEPSMSMEDARYSVIRYFASDIGNAYGPNVHDPRSGEILESHIGWYHNVMKLVHDWYMVQAAAVDPKARKMKFDDSLMGQLIRFVSSHEVGHTLGLLHNMGNSSKTPVEKLRDKTWVEENGHTASIMDYARFNYVAQPEDSISEKGLFPRIGDYDKWAIRWGYGYIAGNTSEAQKAESNKLIIKTLRENPRTYFGTFELGNSNDPRNQAEDLGDNAMKASAYGIKNLKYVLKNLPAWTKEETDQNQNIDEMYTQLVEQFRRYMANVTADVGGVTETIQTSELGGAVYAPTPKSDQREAVAFLHHQLFTTPTWLIDKNIWDKIKNPGDSDPVAISQEMVLNSLLSTERLNRMQVSTDRFGPLKAYSALELLNDIQNGFFSELISKKPTDSYRRRLQRSYVDKISNIVHPSSGSSFTIISFSRSSPLLPTDVSNTDIPSIAREQLTLLKSQIAKAIPVIKDKMSKIHLVDLQQRIEEALETKK